LLLLFPFSTWGQQLMAPGNNPKVSMKFISLNEGISGREINSGLKDDEGYMWFGTMNGLNRFDGKSVRVFNTKDGLLNDSIKFVEKADNNQLWLGSIRFPATIEFQLFDLKKLKAIRTKKVYPDMPFDEKRIQRVVRGDNGTTYFITCAPFQVWKHSTMTGFLLMAEMRDWDVKFVTKTYPNIYDHLNTKYCNHQLMVVARWSPETSVIIRHDSTIKFDAGPNDIIAFNHASKNDFMIEIPSNRITQKQSFRKGYLKSNDRGYYIGISNEEIKAPSIPNRLPWKALETSRTGQFLFYNNSDGVYLFRGDSTITLLSPEDAPKYNAYSFVKAFQDKTDRLWALSSIGIFQFNIVTPFFETLYSKSTSDVLYTNQARGIIAQQGTIISTIWERLNILKKGETSSLIFKSVLYAIKLYGQKCFIGSYGLYELDLNSQKVVEIGSDKLHQIVWSIHCLNDSLLLTGRSNGIYITNRLSRTTSAIRTISDRIPNPVNVYRILPTKQKGLVAVAENGLYLINSKNEVWDYYGPSALNSDHKLNTTRIHDMQVDRGGVCWLATNGEGLWRWDWNLDDATGLKQIRKYDKTDGFKSNILYRIEISNENELWISSYNGLYRFNPATYIVYRYGLNDGLPNDEFNRISSCKGDDGSMYFGGLNGITSFYPRELMNEDAYLDIPFRLTQLEKISSNNQMPVSLMGEYEKNSVIELNPDEKMLSLKFILLDYTSSEKLYAYKIEGVSNTWNYTDLNNILVSGLPYGKYNIVIKAQTEKGGWLKSQITIPINVEKPIYLKPWFLVFCGSLLPLGMFLYYRNRNKRVLKEKRKLEELVQKRTRSLTSALSDREILLKEIHHRVKNNLQVISGLLQLQQAQVKDPEAVKAINEGQSRVSSIALIHQNLYQNDELGSIRFNSFVIDLVKQVGGLFVDKQNQLKSNIDIPDVLLDIDTAVPLGLILNELLTNSCKYAVNGSNDLVISISLRENSKGSFTLEYKDNGKGLEGSLNLKKPSTLGLKLITGLSEQLMGAAHYEFDHGSKFTIKFLGSELRKEKKG
jgi:two-component sensor histidine kinase/sugar lactone lactonase YvrE